ncbi:hypothetical protein G5C51_32345 [Streptomyces sp. A7024]|uniref:Uncharacterized protein n=1 Tax=Streptomyces coryli TaxID=1128680 RepID=A0A6G4U8R2_9ACTN|nr:hypothetical protein [Streptomyces coryli]NGN68574.1 hypothetical protein [Streptomyces coryli]
MMWLVVAVVLCGCIIGVIVFAGGRLMGIIGAVQANAVQLAVHFIGPIVAIGWTLSKFYALRHSKGN